LSEQAEAILETASALVALDRRDLDAAWQRAHIALEATRQPPLASTHNLVDSHSATPSP
jgi:hypothetical protein